MGRSLRRRLGAVRVRGFERRTQDHCNRLRECGWHRIRYLQRLARPGSAEEVGVREALDPRSLPHGDRPVFDRMHRQSPMTGYESARNVVVESPVGNRATALGDRLNLRHDPRRVIHRGRIQDDASVGELEPLRLLCVGLAYFLIGVLVPVASLSTSGELSGFTRQGATMATFAGPQDFEVGAKPAEDADFTANRKGTGTFDVGILGFRSIRGLPHLRLSIRG